MSAAEDDRHNSFDETEDRVRAEAYHLWEAEGKPDGQAERHWDAAKEIVAMRDSMDSTLVPLEESTAPVVEPPLAADSHGDIPGRTDQVDSEQAPSRPARKRTAAASTAKAGRGTRTRT